MRTYHIWLLTSLILAFVDAKIKRGDYCDIPDGRQGRCKRFIRCQTAKYEKRVNNVQPTPCGPDTQLICCDDLGTRTRTRMNPTSTGNGWKSRKKCQEYSRWLNAPTAIFGGGDKIPGTCGVTVEQTIVGGEKAGPLEFPHMAHIGYRQGSQMLWDCGASLISEQYLLTAAHCLFHPSNIRSEVARLGTGDTRSQVKIRIAKEIPHPEYSHPIKYHDIALLQLERPIGKFSDYLRPACLHTEKDINRKEAVASGWGLTEYLGDKSDYLQKVGLPIMDISKCKETYRNNGLMQRGLDESTMICAGGLDLNKDTCQGDSGGPLQIGQREPCVYHLIGVTSFGSGCGIVPGIYTRVSNYIPWIESIVWPN